MNADRLKKKRAATDEAPAAPEREQVQVVNEEAPAAPAPVVLESMPAPVPGVVAPIPAGELDPLTADLIASIPDRPARRTTGTDPAPVAEQPDDLDASSTGPQPFRNVSRPGVLAAGGAVVVALLGALLLGNRAKAPVSPTNNTTFTPAPPVPVVDPLLYRPGRVATLAGRRA